MCRRWAPDDVGEGSSSRPIHLWHGKGVGGDREKPWRPGEGASSRPIHFGTSKVSEAAASALVTLPRVHPV